MKISCPNCFCENDCDSWPTFSENTSRLFNCFFCKEEITIDFKITCERKIEERKKIKEEFIKDFDVAEALGFRSSGGICDVTVRCVNFYHEENENVTLTYDFLDMKVFLDFQSEFGGIGVCGNYVKELIPDFLSVIGQRKYELQEVENLFEILQTEWKISDENDRKDKS